MVWQACAHPDFPEVIAPITGEGPRGIATIPARAGPGRPRQLPRAVRGTRHLTARADQEPLPDRGGCLAPARLPREFFNSAPVGPLTGRLLLANSRPGAEDSARAAGASAGEWGDDHGPRIRDPRCDRRGDGPYETVEGLANEAQPRIGASITHTTRRAGESDRGARAAGVPTDRRMLLEPRETLRN